MNHPERVYELLLDYCDTNAIVDNVLIGLVWTLCQSSHGTGLAMSDSLATRTLPWSGDLIGKPLKDLAAWILQWQPHQASLAMAAINSCINNRPLPDSVALDNTSQNPNLAVFDYFLPQLQGKKVVVIGHYPNIEKYQDLMQLTILERQPTMNDLPDTACEFLFANADWIFLTASSIPNKTFPRLAELATHAKTVLMGATMPWLPQLHEFGIDYLAGIEIIDQNALYHTAAQGGGVRIFNNGLRYRVAQLTSQNSMTWLKQQISDCASERMRLNEEMDLWYANNRGRFPKYALLEQVSNRLSRLDTSYKLLWDNYGNV